jgi:hypothetical protein
MGFFSSIGNFLIEMADVKPLDRLSRGALLVTSVSEAEHDLTAPRLDDGARPTTIRVLVTWAGELAQAGADANDNSCLISPAATIQRSHITDTSPRAIPNPAIRTLHSLNL